MLEALVWSWLVGLFGSLFILGIAVGSFLNVCIYRLPRGKNLFWPSSRCAACLTPIRPTDNLPLLAYWRLGGRCRACGSRFSVRYFLVELIVGVVFAGLYYLEVAHNLHDPAARPRGGWWYLSAGGFPAGSWASFAGEAALASLLVVALGCLLDGEGVPRGLVLFGAAVGLIAGGVERGVPAGLAGVVLPAALVRLADAGGWIGRGGGIGPAAPGLLLMAGGFLGWRRLVVALSLAVAVALIGAFVPDGGRRGRTGRSFAVVLGGGLVVAWLGWGWLGPAVGPALADPAGLTGWLAALAVGLAVVSLRLGGGQTSSPPACAAAGRAVH